MCIICYHEEGKLMPTKEHMINCWTNNPDGAGLAVWREDEKKWEVEKGFMYERDFNEAYERMNLGKEDLFILHWRIATSGKVDAKRTHPFPVTDRCENMLQLKYKRKKIVFHNGVIGPGTDDHSDTMIGIRDWIFPLWKYLKDDKIYYLLEDLWEPSRVLVCDGDAVAEFGNWVHGHGLLWSNGDYVEDKWTKWQRAAEERQAKYGNVIYANQKQLINKETSMFAETIGWNSPYRDAGGHFNWDKFEGEEIALEDWKRIDVDEAEIVGPTDHLDEIIEKTVIGMVDDDGHVHMDETYLEEKVLKNFLCCPNCFEDKYLNDSPFNIGDTICMICGCVYDDPTGEQVCFDPDLNKGFIEHQREVANG